jgi:hypothetical protein
MVLKALRTCKDCSLEAWSDNDLDLFRVDYTMKHNKANLCKKCDNVRKERGRSKENRLDWYYNRNYNISYQEVQDMIEEQKHRCKICNKQEGTTKLTKFVVDHCHTTGEIRGILCGKCNTALGHLEDDVARLARAIEYLN